MFEIFKNFEEKYKISEDMAMAIGFIFGVSYSFFLIFPFADSAIIRWAETGNDVIGDLFLIFSLAVIPILSLSVLYKKYKKSVVIDNLICLYLLGIIVGFFLYVLSLVSL